MNRTPHLVLKITSFLVFGHICCGQFSSAQAALLQTIDIPSSLNPVGSGARALGMGGAFIGVADDATAASWNPGGLIQLETPEISVVGAYFDRTEDNTFGTNSEASGREGVTGTQLNYFSLAHPFHRFERNMVVSLNYQHLYDFSRSWQLPLTESIPGLYTQARNINYEQSGGLAAYGLAYCVQFTPTVSFGLTLNFWENWANQNDWDETIIDKGSGTLGSVPFDYEGKSYDQYSFTGLNANLGMLWRVTPELTLGAVFKTPFTADLDHRHRSSLAVVSPDPALNSTQTYNLDVAEELDMPMSYGLGLAYRFSDQFTVSADLYRTEWGDFTHKDWLGNESSPISGKPESESDISATHQLRLGAEYLFTRQNYAIPFRGGLFYDPAPAEGSSDNFYGFSIGSGISYKQFIFDIAYQYRFAHDVGKSILVPFEFSQDIKEHTLYTSMIVHF
jgi:long-subunit fatty acid transport protein